MKNSSRVLLAVFVATASAAFGEAPSYLGAGEALKKAASLAGVEKPDDGKDSRRKISADIKTFQASLPGLKPADAAAQWLALVDRWTKAQNQGFNEADDSPQLEFGHLVAVLPPPAAWPILAKTLEGKSSEGKAEIVRVLALRWFVHRLLGDVAALRKDFEELSGMVLAIKSEFGAHHLQLLDPLEQEMFLLLDDEAEILRLLDRRLESTVKYSSGRSGYRSDFSVPNLVALVGPEKAAAFLRRALMELPSSLRISSGKDTQDLAAKIALENIASLKVAQWGLAQSAASGALYAAMLGRFGPDTDDHEFLAAQRSELFRLFLAGKADEARAFCRSLDTERSSMFPPHAVEVLESAGRLSIAADVLGSLLAENPNLPFWSEYINICVRSGEADKMVALLQKSLARKELEPSTRATLMNSYADVLLAAGKVDEGIPELVKAAEKSLSDVASPSGVSFDGGNDAIKIARIGLLLGRQPWVEKGHQLAEAFFKKKMGDPDSASDFSYYAVSYAQLLLDLGQGPAAEGVLIDTLGTIEALSKKQPGRYFNSSMSVDVLAALVGLYTAAQRPADVMVLLDQAPGWEARDISAISRQSCYIGQDRSASLGVCAARALLAQGRKDEARRILEAMLIREAGDDRIYETLVELDGPATVPLLDRVFARDPFQERPLVWKARLLLDEGKLDEAEKIAREAIKIDPSDGEEGSGDRMRVYAVLADILAARGDAKQAEFFRGVVRAIRKSELADDLHAQGLLSRAIELYKESLNDFADAYCIQSRLALRLAEQGDWKGAEEHYRRAYELMPDSFGRVESHCFGCERAFAGEKQESLAEKIFTGMTAHPPVKPQVYYLLGYLRMEHDRFQEAFDALRKAVELDPDYLNAWIKLSSAADQLRVPPGIRNEIAGQLLRLQPYGRPDLRGVTDLASIWDRLAKSQPPVPTTDLYPLQASARAMAESEKEATDPFQKQMLMARMMRGEEDNFTPGGRFAEQYFTRAVDNILQNSNSLFER